LFPERDILFIVVGVGARERTAAGEGRWRFISNITL
jgi:hypothetical protein